MPESAAVLLEKASPPERAPWDMRDRIATLRLHLGEPARAARWENGLSPSRNPGYAKSRIGTTYLAENDFESGRKHYREALEAKPDLFEALTAWPCSNRTPAMPPRPSSWRRKPSRRAQ